MDATAAPAAAAPRGTSRRPAVRYDHVVSAVVRHHRVARGATQRAFAVALGMSRIAVCNRDCGVQPWAVSDLALLGLRRLPAIMLLLVDVERVVKRLEADGWTVRRDRQGVVRDRTPPSRLPPGILVQLRGCVAAILGGGALDDDAAGTAAGTDAADSPSPPLKG